MKRDNLFLKYWYLWLLVLLLPPLVLYWIISRPCGFDAIGAEKAPEIWLGFWGGYLGAVISAAVAFFILNKQLTANHAENERNRKLQLKTIEYQQRMQWLNDFKKVAAEFIVVFNDNKLINAQNNMYDNPDLSYRISGEIIEELKITTTQMNMYYTNDDELITKLYSETSIYRERFREVVNDINSLTTLILNCRESKKDGEILYRENIKEVNDPKGVFSESMRELTKDKTGLNLNDIVLLAEQRRESVQEILPKISMLLVRYINEEQQRINNILLQ